MDKVPLEFKDSVGSVLPRGNALQHFSGFWHYLKLPVSVVFAIRTGSNCVYLSQLNTNHVPVSLTEIDKWRNYEFRRIMIEESLSGDLISTETMLLFKKMLTNSLTPAYFEVSHKLSNVPMQLRNFVRGISRLDYIYGYIERFWPSVERSIQADTLKVIKAYEVILTDQIFGDLVEWTGKPTFQSMDMTVAGGTVEYDRFFNQILMRRGRELKAQGRNFLIGVPNDQYRETAQELECRRWKYPESRFFLHISLI
ncbi:hypothetical protein L596_009005 [Steinernema carpocapsae]|uniref:Uncharacterized protein n=1 Tax=Steinernema carpocapsae TaxID=34508 RepID=A0A4U5PF98_STECR|nr:hypothetical protein L596_009005 [Steinernema carpocapsae]